MKSYGFFSPVILIVLAAAPATAQQPSPSPSASPQVPRLAEEITVSAEAPLLDTTSALNQTVLSRTELDALPNRSNIWSIARVIPSVTLNKVDVGGSESYLNSTATGHGSSSENKYMIDGMDVSSTDGNGTIAAFYLDPFTYQEANYQIGAGSAETQNGRSSHRSARHG